MRRLKINELETISERTQALEAKLAAIALACHALSEREGGEAREYVRGLIEKIVLSTNKDVDGLKIDLYGDLAGILSIAQEKKDMEELKRLRLLSANDNKPEALVDLLISR